MHIILPLNKKASIVPCTSMLVFLFIAALFMEYYRLCICVFSFSNDLKCSYVAYLNFKLDITK